MNTGNLPKDLWLEAVQTLRNHRNRIIHTFTGDRLFNRWFNRKLSLIHLRTYDCLAYIHIPQQRRNKLEPRAQKGVLAGYSSSTRGYSILIPESDQILESKHIRFDEDRLGNEWEHYRVGLGDVSSFIS